MKTTGTLRQRQDRAVAPARRGQGPSQDAALLAPDCDQALDTLMRAVDRHTGGHAHDDMALLLLENGASVRSSANGHIAAVPAAAAP